MPIRFELEVDSSPRGPRAGRLTTRRGSVETPAFMPVATHAHVRAVDMDQVHASGARMCLANTYHLLLRPGTEVLERFGGVHRFMRWEGPVLTDSGGYQIFSLPEEREVSEEGARFRSPYDNHAHLLSPESSIAIQRSIGSEVMMVLDVCPPATSPRDVTREAMERTHRWAARSLAERDRDPRGQALFGIVQGGVFLDLRTESAQAITALPFDGFAIGGVAVGESRESQYAVTAHAAPLLPRDKPRYLMGVGMPIDLVESVERGVDLFDCIIPNKLAQQGYAFTFEGTLRISRAEHRLDERPLDATCACPVCQRYSRAYLRHLAQGSHLLGAALLTQHNLWHYQALMRRLRAAIVEGRWEAEARTLRELLGRRYGGSKDGPPAPASPRLKGERHEVVTTRGGAAAIKSLVHKEVMHPVGPWEEANRLYVGQLGVAARLRQRQEEPLRILDLGLGAGSNAVAALHAALELGQERRRDLEVISLEEDLEPLRLSLSNDSGFHFPPPLREAAQALLDDGRWETHGLSWRLIPGDAEETLDEVEGAVELVFFDPFSPDANAPLWGTGFLRRLKARMRYQGALLATYSAATPTRVALLLSGFFVGAGLSTGTKGETTVASTVLDWLERPLDARWLERWERSDARAPHGQPFSPEVERAIRQHPQFQR